MGPFDNDKDLNTLDEMFLESLKGDEKELLNDEIKIDINTPKKEDEIASILTKDYNDIDTIKSTTAQINTTPVPLKRGRGRPKGSIKKTNRKQVASEKLTISLSKEEKEILEKEAQRDHRSVSSFIKLKLTQAGVFIKK